MNRGFALVEFIVTIAIMGLITTILFSSYPSFSDQVNIERTAQEVLLAARDAQVLSSSISQTGGIYPAGYGIHFDTAIPDTFLIFADLPATENDIYDGPAEDVRVFKIKTGDTITSLCVISLIPCNSTATLDVIYKRPFLLAKINNNDSLYEAKVTIQSPKGRQKVIDLWKVGQIAID